MSEITPTVDLLDLPSSTQLHELSPDQVEFISTGLIRNFGTTLTQPEELKKLNLLMLALGTGEVVAIDTSCTIGDVWNVSERAHKDGGLPGSRVAIKKNLNPQTR